MGLDIAGDDDIGYDEMGAFGWGRGRGRGRRRPRPVLPAVGPRAAQSVMPDVPGAPRRSLGLYPAAFPTVSFALADGTNVKTVTMNPQTAFKGQRPFAQLVRNGASAALTTVLITQLLVGMTPVIVTPDGVPAEMFGAGAYDTNLLLPPTEPGVLYQLSVKLPVALTTTDTILLIFGITGTAYQ